MDLKRVHRHAQAICAARLLWLHGPWAKLLLNHELARESLLCMSSHTKRLPEANLATIHSLSLAACLAGTMRDCLIRTVYHSSESKFLCVLPTHST